MLAPSARAWLRHGAKKDGGSITPQYEAVLRSNARDAITAAFSDMVTILLSTDDELRAHLEGELAQFERIRPILKPGAPSPRLERPLTKFKEEE